jgi:hypothetical protein
MTYTKPQVVLIGSALATIQGQSGQKFMNEYPDHTVNPIVDDASTTTAYEADE